VECDKILTENGFAPPPALSERPKVEVEDIPAGARFSDQEIGAMIAISNSAGLTACSAVMGSGDPRGYRGDVRQIPCAEDATGT